MLDKGIGLAIGALVIFTIVGILAVQINTSTKAQVCPTGGTLTAIDGATTVSGTIVPVGVAVYKGTLTDDDVKSFYIAGLLCYKGSAPTSDVVSLTTDEAKKYVEVTQGTGGSIAGALAYKFDTIKSLIFIIPLGIIVFLLLAGFNMYRKKYA